VRIDVGEVLDHSLSSGTMGVIEWVRGRGVESESESESESPGVWVLARSRSRSRSLLQEGDSDSGHILILNCTLNLVLRGFDRCIVLAGRATSSMSCHHATLLPHIQLEQ